MLQFVKLYFCWLYSTILLQPICAAHIGPNNLTYFETENVAYDTVGNTVKMSTQANVTCLENIAYATTVNTSQKGWIEDTSTSHTAVYDEVYPKNDWLYPLHAQNYFM